MSTPNIRWKVECLFAHGWDDAEWTVDGEPQRFTSVAEAEAEIDEHIADAAEAGLEYSRSEYRVVVDE